MSFFLCVAVKRQSDRQCGAFRMSEAPSCYDGARGPFCGSDPLMRAGDHPSSLHTADDAEEQWVRTTLCSADACRHLAHFCTVQLRFFISCTLEVLKSSVGFCTFSPISKNIYILKQKMIIDFLLGACSTITLMRNIRNILFAKSTELTNNLRVMQVIRPRIT